MTRSWVHATTSTLLFLLAATCKFSAALEVSSVSAISSTSPSASTASAIFSTSPSASPASATSSTTSSASLSPSASSTSKRGSLSVGALGGIIVLGALVLIALVLGAMLLFLRRIKNANKSRGMSQGPYDNGGDGNGYGAPAGNYEYNPMAESHQEQYAYQPAGVEQTARAELGAQRPVTELATGPLTPPARHLR